MLRKKHTSSGAFGIDIADGSIEAVRLVRDRSSWRIVQASRRELPDQTIIHGAVYDAPLVAHVLEELRAEVGATVKDFRIHTALPDTQVLMRIVPIEQHGTLAQDDLADRARAVLRALNIPLERMAVSWRFAKSGAGSRLIVACAERELINEWRSLFSKAGYPLLSIEMESLALARAHGIRASHQRTIGLLDLGFRSTSFSLYDEKGIVHSHAIDIGSSHLTTLLENALSTTAGEAEQIKRERGFSDPKIAKTLGFKLEEIIAELDCVSELASNRASELVLTGGGALIPGLREWLSPKLNVPLSLGALPHGGHGAPIDEVRLNPVLYAGAVGCALSGFTRLHETAAINFISP